jgi:hypothetical protein
MRKTPAYLDSLAYVWLLFPTLLVALFHFKALPNLLPHLGRALKGAALPSATQISLQAAPFIATLPIFISVLGVASIRFSFLRNVHFIAIIGGLLATLAFLYGASLFLPFVTFTEILA